jgi:hypothetical protein
MNHDFLLFLGPTHPQGWTFATNISASLAFSFFFCVGLPHHLDPLPKEERKKRKKTKVMEPPKSFIESLAPKP